MLDPPAGQGVADGTAFAGRGSGGTRLSEGLLGSLVQLAGWGADFPAAVTPHLARLGLAGPGDFRDVQTAGAVQSFRIAPDRILLRQTAGTPMISALAEIDRTRLVALDLSHARQALLLEGGSVEHVLSQFAAIDFALPSFAVGQFAQIGVDQIGCLVHRRSAHAFELLVPSSYAPYLGEAIGECLAHDLFRPEP